MAHGKRVVIIGAGCFGLSTAYHLLLRGYQVTVIDRSVVLPAPDAASSDLNKVVRSSYEDLYFARLARKAIQAWKDSKWDGAYKESVCFHLFAAGKDRSADRLGSRSGVITLGGGTAQGAYTTAALANDKDLGADVTEIKDEASFKSYFPLPNDSVGSFSYDLGYVNRDGGWANATKAVTLLLNEVRGLGGDVHGGTEVSGLRSDTGGRVIGVELVSGDTLNGDIVVVATGAWTPSLFPDQGLQTKLLATGQSVATVHLSSEVSARYANCPVVLNFSTGFYVFPPNEDGVVKFAIHGAGYINPVPTTIPSSNPISTPRTIISHPPDSHPDKTAIPETMITELREGLRTVYPDLAGMPFESTRLCWYSDTPDSDWLIDFHPDHPNLLFATGGSGHAFKFLPVIGELIANRLDGTLDPVSAQKFSFTRVAEKQSTERSGLEPRLLREQDLGAVEDLRKV